jgi:hypothetical protein
MPVVWEQRNRGSFLLNKSPQAPLEPMKRKSMQIPLPLSLLLWALFFLAGVISMPFSLVGAIVQKRKEARFARRMKEAGRFMKWQTFEQELKSGHGTAIVECFSLEGPARIWWTQEELSAPESSHRGMFTGCLMNPACNLCVQVQSLYTSSENGKANLVARPAGKKGEYRKIMESVTEARHITTRGSVPTHKSKSR